MKSIMFVLEIIAAIVSVRVLMLIAMSEVSFTSLLAMGLILYGIYYFVLDLIDLFIYVRNKHSESERERRNEK